MTESVLERKVLVPNKKGLHARAAAKFVRVAEGFSGVAVEVVKDGQSVGGTSIMGLLMLAAGKNSEITIRVTGAGAAPSALEALSELVTGGFGEE